MPTHRNVLILAQCSFNRLLESPKLAVHLNGEEAVGQVMLHTLLDGANTLLAIYKARIQLVAIHTLMPSPVNLLVATFAIERVVDRTEVLLASSIISCKLPGDSDGIEVMCDVVGVATHG